MNIRNTKLCKIAALASAVLVVASFTINNAALALTLTCNMQSPGGTGCQVGNGCPWFEPNQGIIWDQNEKCTY